MFWTVSLDGGPKRVNHAAVKMGHYIYSFGGYYKDIDFEQFSPISVYVLNTVNLRWSEIKIEKNNEKCCPFQRYGHTAVEHGTDIIIWGGRNDNTTCNRVFIFDSRTREWRIPEVTGDVPPPRDGHSACVIDGRMYIFGGFLDEVNVFSSDVFYLDLKTMCWTKVKINGNKRPPGRDFLSAPVVGSRMYIMGGRGHLSHPVNYYPSADKYWSSVYYLDTVTNTWHKPVVKGDIPIGRRSLSTFVINDFIYMFGGCNGSMEKHFNDVYRFNTLTDEWKYIQPVGTPPCARRRQCCIVVGNRAFIFGGSCPKPGSGPPPFGYLTIPPDLHDFHMYLDADGHRNDLEDLDDLHILEFGIPTLTTLCIMEVIKNKLRTEFLPLHLQQEIKNMSTPNSIPS